VSTPAAPPSGPKGLRRLLHRLTSTDEELAAEDLMDSSREAGATPVRQCEVGQRVRVSGKIRALTLRPVGGVPALEAEVYDGSGILTVVWLGRRRIEGVDPGRVLSVEGRVTTQQGRRVMFNPAYELRA
jgi:hypothetical protein